MIPLTFGPCLGLAAAYGSTGFAVGMVIAFASYAILGWRLLLRVAKRRSDSDVPEPAPGPDPVTSPS
jgi:hypothetical protein